MTPNKRSEFDRHGYTFNDTHGDPWSIPVIRSRDGMHATATCHRVVTEGEQEPQSRYLWELSGQIFDHYIGEVTLPRELLAAAAVEIAAINYEIDAELSKSGLFDDAYVMNVLKAAIDWPTAERYMKLPDKDRQAGNFHNSRLILIHHWMRGRVPNYAFSRADHAVGNWMSQAERPVEIHSHYHVG